MPLTKKYHLLAESESVSDSEAGSQVDHSDNEKENEVSRERVKRTTKAPARYREDFVPSLSKHEFLAGEGML